jgi:hypothetical protein
MTFILENTATGETHTVSLDQARAVSSGIGDDWDIPDCLARGFGCYLQDRNGNRPYYLSRWS